MTKTSTTELEEFTQRYHQLILSSQTLTLSTVSTLGVPGISYAPFVRDHAGTFYIYVSELASHTTNLLNNPLASILFIRPEAESRNLFARERVALNCRVKEIMPDELVYTNQLQALQDKFGEVVSVLRSLSDFHLFALHPESGRYVIGFGKAFNISSHDGSLHAV